MTPDLEKEISKSRLSPSVKVFEGKDAVKSMSEGALSSKEKIIFSIGSTKKLTALLGGKYGWGRRRRALGLFQRALRFLSDETISAPARFHDVRILPDTFDFPGYLLIFDDSTAIIPFEKPVRGILITDHVFAVMAKSVFEILWKLGEKTRKNKKPARLKGGRFFPSFFYKVKKFQNVVSADDPDHRAILINDRDRIDPVGFAERSDNLLKRRFVRGD